jgi:hypothetical protein
MQNQDIAEVGIEDDRRVYVRPVDGDFEQIYRAAMEVHWDRETGRLSHPAPRNLTPLQWYQQIIVAVSGEYGIRLLPTAETVWLNIPSNLRIEMEALQWPPGS